MTTPIVEIDPVAIEPLCCGVCGARADYVCDDAPPTCTLHKNSCCRAITPAVVVSYGDDLRFAVELARTAIDLAEQHGADQREVAGLRQALERVL